MVSFFCIEFNIGNLYRNSIKKTIQIFIISDLLRLLFLYTLFILICGVSKVVAENREEGVMAFSKLLTTYSGGLLLFFISQKNKIFFFISPF
jgi:hypothetical protein